jgi:hypothetical protein
MMITNRPFLTDNIHLVGEREQISLSLYCNKSSLIIGVGHVNIPFESRSRCK